MLYETFSTSPSQYNVTVPYFLSTGEITQETLDSAMESIFATKQTAADFRDILNNEIIPMYSDTTNFMVVMNNSFNSANYIHDDFQQKKTEAQRIHEKTKNNVAKEREVFFQQRRTIGYNTFLSGMIQALIVVVGVSGIMFGLWGVNKISTKMLGAVVSIMLMCLLLVLAILVKNNLTRRVDDWNKFYFSPYTVAP